MSTSRDLWCSLGIEPQSRNSHLTSSTNRPRTRNYKLCFCSRIGWFISTASEYTQTLQKTLSYSNKTWHEQIATNWRKNFLFLLKQADLPFSTFKMLKIYQFKVSKNFFFLFGKKLFLFQINVFFLSFKNLHSCPT